MDWRDILLLKSWTPLSRLHPSPQPVAPGLCQVGPHAFLLLRDVNRRLERNDPDAPFVTRAYWATSLEAVLRIKGGGDAGIGGQAPGECPPAELLLGSSCRYGDLLGAAIAQRLDPSERAQYSNTGEFLCRLIGCGRFEYLFLGRADDPNERPFLVDIRLPRE